MLYHIPDSLRPSLDTLDNDPWLEPDEVRRLKWWKATYEVDRQLALFAPKHPFGVLRSADRQSLARHIAFAMWLCATDRLSEGITAA